MDRIAQIPAAVHSGDWQDLEAHLVNTRAAASALAIVVDQIIESRHPNASDTGYARLLVDEDTLEAASYLMADLLARTREAAEAYQGCVRKRKRN